MKKSYLYIPFALVIAGTVVGYQKMKTIPAPILANAPATENDEMLLRRGALQRFGTSVATITYGGSAIKADDEHLNEELKVGLFKRTLSKQEQLRDPAFRAKAEDEVRMRQPVNASIAWDDLSGNQQTDFLIKDTRGCSQAAFATKKIAARDLAKLGCIELPSLQNRWDDNATLEITLQTVEEETPVWSRLVQEQMGEMAVAQFVATARAH
jgi:hypothetical protein